MKLASLNGQQTQNGSSVEPDPIKVEDIAAQTDNPKLWLTKYDFYINVLKLSQAEAIRWADADVTINTEARHEFGLPPAKSQRAA